MNSLELINEALVMTSCYYMYMFSDGLINMPNPGYPEFDEILSDVDVMFQVGWVQIGHLFVLVAINFLVMAGS